MAKKAYIGVDGVARKVKKGYLGIDGVARKVKKAYIGIGGVARPCWSGGELTSSVTITPLSVARRKLAATSVGNYALFGGGYCSTTTGNKTVDGYDTSLTRVSVTNFKDPREDGPAATSVGKYAIFGGGATGVTNGEVYDSSLTYIYYDILDS